MNPSPWLLIGSGAALAGSALILGRRGSVKSPKHLAAFVKEAEKDIAKSFDRSSTEKGGPLEAIFRDSGWNVYRITYEGTTGRPEQWCGMSVAAWATRAGLRPEHRNAFWHTSHIEKFFTYAKSSRVVSTLDGSPIEQAHAAHAARRSYWPAKELRAIPPKQWAIQPGDIVLINHKGQTSTPDHVGMVHAFDGRYLTTLEGNASGVLQNGKRTAGGAVAKKRDLNDAKVRNTIFGVGRFSPLDFQRG